MTERYEDLVTRALALAAEARIYRNESVPGECVQLHELSEALYAALVDSAAGAGVSWDELMQLADAADRQAVGRVAERV